MAELKFLQEFFAKNKCELKNITVTLEERPCYDIRSEDYRFRVKIAEVIDELDIRYRDLAIEDHHKQAKHQKPHIQFKLHADRLGHIYISLPVENVNEYKEYILSFLDIIGSILIRLDNTNKELQTTFMILNNFKKIRGKGNKIKQLVYDHYNKKELKLIDLEKKERDITPEDLKQIKSIPQISPFFEKI
ncbi:hypothetical protein FJZ53_00555 [Candidatus Woesearchaeota archaeon]|nr:hypothetical protein [Candidatus Woesearchaeota archaeon]